MKGREITCMECGRKSIDTTKSHTKKFCSEIHARRHNSRMYYHKNPEYRKRKLLKDRERRENNPEAKRGAIFSTVRWAIRKKIVTKQEIREVMRSVKA